jgi:hypothetical protein
MQLLLTSQISQRELGTKRNEYMNSESIERKNGNGQGRGFFLWFPQDIDDWLRKKAEDRNVQTRLIRRAIREFMSREVAK